MGKQINQYTKTRTAASITLFDYMDLDSTEDSGTTFESAKLTISELMKYINTNGLNIYNDDASIISDRTLFANTYFTKWDGGDVGIEMSDAINDYGFFINNDLGVEKARFGFDQTTSSGILELNNSGGLFFSANDGIVLINKVAPFSTAVLSVQGSAAISSSLSLGNEPIISASLSMPDNWKMIIGGTARLGANSGTTYLDAGNDNVIEVRNNSNFVYSKYNNNLFELNSIAASVSFQTRSYDFNIYGQYWDGATTQLKQAQIKHNVTTGITGESQIDISIGGTVMATIDEDSTAGNTRFLIYDVDNGTLERVSVGVADSGGVGFKLLRIPN